MESFSEKYGHKVKKSFFQVKTMDNDLRVGLWNVLSYIWGIMEDTKWLSSNFKIKALITEIWKDYFKYPVDEIPLRWLEVLDKLKSYFFNCEWNEVYDFVQFVANSKSFNDTRINKSLREECNSIMERELAGYQFVKTTIAPITSQQEITEVEQALTAKKPIAAHFKRALELLSDKEDPDYRNSIKESVSGVEAICALIVGNKKATLGEALDIIKKQDKVDVHPALNTAFDKLYGYSSDADGIRHALSGESTLSFEDAKFMLVSCSAFVNYLIMKAQKAGIGIKL